MSPVQGVTEVPVHSLLSRLGFLAGRGAQGIVFVFAFQPIRGGVAGRNEVVTKLKGRKSAGVLSKTRDNRRDP
jgi:hypothetical protein